MKGAEIMSLNNDLTTIRSLIKFPYFVLRNEIESGYSEYTKELVDIRNFYEDYKKGAIFYPEGTGGDYVASDTRFKIMKTLIDREARFMFSQTPEIKIKSRNIEDEDEGKKIDQYNLLISQVLKESKFQKTLLQSAKDCFIGKRVACLVDYSLEDGIQVHFYNSLQFYYETEYSSENISKFVTFEVLNETRSTNERMILVNRYENKNNSIYMSSILYFGNGQIKETLISEHKIQLDYIPAVVILNNGTLDDKTGTSEIESLREYESLYSKLANADVDSLRKNANPIRVLVDMNSKTTVGLSSSAGSLWDLKSEQNQNITTPTVTTLSPSLAHSEPLKTTLDRVKGVMYNELDIPNITEDMLQSAITSSKAMRSIYWSLTVRCNEKLKTWIPSIEHIVKSIIDLSIINLQQIKERYALDELRQMLYDIVIKENYAILDDEIEEKEFDLQEINSNTRSRYSYYEKYRKEELNTQKKREEELLQIAYEKNMLDTMSMNTQVQGMVQDEEDKLQIDENIERLKVKEEIKQNNEV